MGYPRTISSRTTPISLKTCACLAEADQAYFHRGIVQRSHRSTLSGYLASRTAWVCARSPNPLLQ